MPTFPMSYRSVLRALDGGLRIAGRLPSAHRVRGVSTDTRTLRNGDLFVALSGERFDGRRFLDEAFARGASAAVVPAGTVRPRGTGRPVIEVRDPVCALGQLAASHRDAIRARVVAITGSVGKTTTRTILAHLLEGSGVVSHSPRSFNNAVGVPLTLLRADENTDFLLVEIGTNAPGEVRTLSRLARPEIGVVTRVAAAHLEGLGNIDGVFEEKADLVRQLSRETGIAVLNADDERVAAMARWAPAGLVRYSTGSQGTVRGRVEAGPESTRLHLVLPRGRRCSVTLPFLGRANAENALAALATAHALGLDAAELAPRLETATLPPRRLERHDLRGVTVLDDAYNANPTSLAASLEVLANAPGRRVLVLGDMLELGAETWELHRQAGEAAVRAGVTVMACVGSMAHRALAAALKAGLPAGGAIPALHPEEAVEELASRLRPGDTVLVKGSNATRLDRVVAGLKDAIRGDAPAGDAPKG